MLGLIQVGSGDHKFPAAGLEGSLEDTCKVIGMGLFAVILTAKDRIGKVDANLQSL